jgi:hypothetical protein
MGMYTTTGFYMLCGCLDYAAFSNAVSGNILIDFGFYEPFWLVGFANACIIMHLVDGFQGFCQPRSLFVAVEGAVATRYPESTCWSTRWGCAHAPRAAPATRVAWPGPGPRPPAWPVAARCRGRCRRAAVSMLKLDLVE